MFRKVRTGGAVWPRAGLHMHAVKHNINRVQRERGGMLCR
jgi:hypothetical protein